MNKEEVRLVALWYSIIVFAMYVIGLPWTTEILIDLFVLVKFGLFIAYTRKLNDWHKLVAFFAIMNFIGTFGSDTFNWLSVVDLVGTGAIAIHVYHRNQPVKKVKKKRKK